MADVQKLGSVFAEDVHAKEFERFAVEEELEAAFGLAADLSARDFAVIGDTDFIGDVFVGELLFGFANEGNLRDGVDA